MVSAQQNQQMQHTEAYHSLFTDLQNYCQQYSAKIGIGYKNLKTGETLFLHNDKVYPTMSVYKFHLALYILHLVDQKRLTIDTIIHIKRSELSQNTWSPMLKDKKGNEIALSVKELIEYSVGKSDNNACDILFELAGGPAKVHEYFGKLGIKKMGIHATEKEMHDNPASMFTNFTNPAAAIEVLTRFHAGTLLSKNSNDILFSIMRNSENPSTRIKAGLPASAKLAHKTGTGDIVDNKIFAVNDIGIVECENSNQYAICVFVHQAAMKEYEQCDAIIAEISRKIYNYAMLNK
jgi:beta-lactamase class A